jgi:glycosyltransferase involved in cell wall biosynthesis
MNNKYLYPQYDVSVVIPTLGGPSLRGTIEKINSGTLIPKEILVCIPEEYSYKVEYFSYENVKIIKTPFGGQVRQRVQGFKLVKYPFVLQLDDDIDLEESCLFKLTEFLNANPYCSVSPTLLDNITGKASMHMSEPDTSSGLLYRFLFWIVNGRYGYQAGKISKSGVNIGFSSVVSEPYEVEWLPGGCALHSKEHLITFDYYPYKGKAFAEDLFHTFLLRKNGVKLYHFPGANALLDNSSSKGAGIISLINIFFSYTRIMFRFANLSGSNKNRLFFFIIINYFILISRKLKKIIPLQV